MRITTFLKNIFNADAEGQPIDAGDIVNTAVSESNRMNYWWGIKATEFKVYNEKLSSAPDKEKISFILQQMDYIGKKDHIRTQHGDRLDRTIYISKTFIEQLLRSKLDMEEAEICRLSASFINVNKNKYLGVTQWPLKSLVAIVQKKYKGKPVPQPVEQALVDLKNAISEAKKMFAERKDAIKLIEQIDVLLFKGDNENAVKPVYFLGDDDFAAYANKMLDDLPPAERLDWNKLMELCQKANGSAPSKKFMDEGKSLISGLGEAKFREMVLNWLNFISRLKERLTNDVYYITHIFVVPVNADCMKGFLWLSTEVADTELLQAIAAVADRAYRKIPGIGQTCTILGNACVYTLFKSPGLEGVSHLSRLRLRVKQAGTQALIEKYIAAAATDRGVSVEAIEDLAVDDFGLANGKFTLELEGFKAEVSIEKVGKVNLVWHKKDGSTQAADPAIVKEKQAAELKKLKATCKAIEASLSTQRDRFDQRFRSTGKMSWQHFNENYFDHGLVSFISHKLIWHFEKEDESFDSIYLDGNWTDHSGKQYHPGESHLVSLWHPVLDTLANVQQWRTFLIEKQLQQPLKQAFREIYLLTDAELNTRTYSNRMAGHILKQHQFNSLAKARGWRYALQGAFDGGVDVPAKLYLKENQLVVEYWVDAVNARDEINQTGIFNYISTDQVRFKNSQNVLLNLVDIPAVIFSEVMRDVDLFVGVASVGNDPTWRDSGGLPGYRDYWNSYSFGDLNEVAKGRKEILERLLPRLKIAKVARIDGKFLVVKGKKRVYKIHIGSTNILMEPNDQYLCIVADRPGKTSPDNVFLPFEGDNGLSIIISKALLLADDDKITDETITRQIDR